MKVVILCGGLGTRLREETEFRPKPLVEVGGRPILWHIMKLYAYHGFHDFILALGYRGNMIKDYFLNYEAMNNDFTICLGEKSHIHYNDHHAEQDFRMTLARAAYRPVPIRCQQALLRPDRPDLHKLVPAAGCNYSLRQFLGRRRSELESDRPPHYSLERARQILGWQPLFTPESALSRTISWYQEFFHAQ